MSVKQTLFNHLKNIPGWRTKCKLVVISVDDYGNVRLDSKEARKNMDQAGLKVHSRFDAYDTLETREDLEQLYEVLSSVKDKNGKHAVFTPFALPCNINFEKMAEEGYQEYHYELLPETYAKLTAKDPESYEGAWALWQEGIHSGLMVPQFHGREHFNLKVFEEKLAQDDHEVLTALKNRSYTSISNTGYPTIGWTAAFAFWDPVENERLLSIALDGLAAFEKVFGYAATHFMAPTARVHDSVLTALAPEGILLVDTALVQNQHLGKGKFKRILNFTGKRNKAGQRLMVRNVVFEPAFKDDIESVNVALRQIDAAFKWNRPAVISSHRVNYCGHISEDNRKKGLIDLKRLLSAIVKRWPDVEFMSSRDLQMLMKSEASL